MTYGEADTLAKLIDPAIHRRGWTEDHIKRELTAGAIDIIEGQPRRRARGRCDYLLRLRLRRDTQPVAVAVLEAKAENIDGKAVPITVEEYKQRLAARLVSEAATLEQFRGRWVEPRERREMMAALPEQGRSALLVRDLEEMEPYDLYDVLGELAYGLQPLTRVYRAGAFNYKHAGWLGAMPEKPRNVIGALVNQFALAGTDGLENREVFRVPEVIQAGGLSALRQVGDPFEVLKETKARVFAG